VYALLYRVPGVGIAKEVNSAAYLVANTVFLAGVFSFAAVIGEPSLVRSWPHVCLLAMIMPQGHQRA
jgi:hypothetical protein